MVGNWEKGGRGAASAVNCGAALAPEGASAAPRFLPARRVPRPGAQRRAHRPPVGAIGSHGEPCRLTP